MFMTFKCCDNEGNPMGHRVCINVKDITNVTELGQWTHVAQPMVEFDDQMFQDELARPPRPRPTPRRPTARARQADTFQVTPGCVMINTMNQNYTVVADFEELSKMLESLHNMFES